MWSEDMLIITTNPPMYIYIYIYIYIYVYMYVCMWVNVLHFLYNLTS